MDYLMSLNLSWTEWLLGAYVVLYGYILGAHNTINRIKAIFTGRQYILNTLGEILDLVWYVTITLTVLDVVTGA